MPSRWGRRQRSHHSNKYLLEGEWRWGLWSGPGRRGAQCGRSWPPHTKDNQNAPGQHLQACPECQRIHKGYGARACFRRNLWPWRPFWHRWGERRQQILREGQRWWASYCICYWLNSSIKWYFQLIFPTNFMLVVQIYQELCKYPCDPFNRNKYISHVIICILWIGTGCGQNHNSVWTSTIQLLQGSSHLVRNLELSSWLWLPMQTFHKYYLAVLTQLKNKPGTLFLVLAYLGLENLLLNHKTQEILATWQNTCSRARRSPVSLTV